MQSNRKYLYYCLLILCGGFAALEYIEGNPKNATWWLFALALVILGHSFLVHKKKAPAASEMNSILEPETKQALENGEQLHFKPAGIRLRSSETCLWYDTAAQDYYGATEGKMYLTDERLVFVADGFSFAHPLRELTLKPTRNGFELEIRGNKMKFITASTPLFLKIWSTQK